MSETKILAIPSPDVSTACNIIRKGPGIDALRYLVSLFGVKDMVDATKRQLGEFVRLCQLGMESNTLEELKHLIRADAGPPEPTYEDVVDAAAALRKRLNEDAVRWLCRRCYCRDTSSLRRFVNPDVFRKFIRLSRLEASTADEFALSLADTHNCNWAHEARAPLPDDLRVLALEYRCNKDLAADIDGCSVFDQIGCFSRHKPNETTIFGKDKSKNPEMARIRVDVIARQSDLDNG